MGNKLAIFAALPEEADAFMAGEGEVLPDAPFAIRDIGDVVVATCGIGKVNIAAAVMMLVERYQPSLLAMTGTCGRVSEIAGDTFWIAEAVQHDYGVVRTGAFAHYQGGEWPMGPEGHPPFLAMPDPGLNLLHARIGSGDAFVACPDHGATLVSRLGIDLVDMEVAAMAQLAARLGLPWAAIKSVSDDADGKSARDFRENLIKASTRAAQAMERLVAVIGAT
jgi:adenosylhomocysteine nucleosidase